MSFEEEVDEIEAETILGGAPFFSRPGGKIFIIWLVFTVIGVLIGVYAPHHLLPGLHSPEGGDVWATIVVFTVLAAPVAALVYAIAFYSLFAWRHRSDDPDEPPPDAEPQRGNGPITVVWLTVSTLLVVVLLFWGITVWSAQQVVHPERAPGERDRPAVAVDATAIRGRGSRPGRSSCRSTVPCSST